jgi:hypothetical protein
MESEAPAGGDVPETPGGDDDVVEAPPTEMPGGDEGDTGGGDGGDGGDATES